ncbi:MAG TPA: secretin N-terminal domain-containing protein [bacterium]|nr:secretin N-terminal domain-containing protein [bacterium]
MKNKLYYLTIIFIFFNFCILTAATLKPSFKWYEADNTITFEMNLQESIIFETLELSETQKIVIDFFDAKWQNLKKNNKHEINIEPLKRIRLGQFKPTIARLVFDLFYNCKYEVIKDEKKITVIFYKQILDNSEQKKISDTNSQIIEKNQEEKITELPKENPNEISSNLNEQTTQSEQSPEEQKKNELKQPEEKKIEEQQPILKTEEQQPQNQQIQTKDQAPKQAENKEITAKEPKKREIIDIVPKPQTPASSKKTNIDQQEKSEIKSDNLSQKIQQQQPRQTTTSTAVMLSAAPSAPSAIPQKQEQEQSHNTQNLITLDLKDADIHNVLRLIAQATGMNIVVSSDISAKITVSLKNTPLLDALDSILKVNGYSYLIEGNIIKVAPTQVLLNLPNTFTTKIYKLQFAFVEEAAKPIKTILSKNGTIEILRSSNSLMITDLQEYIDKVNAVIKHLDSKELWDKKKNEFFEETKIIKLKYMTASSAKNVISRLTPSGSGIIDFDDNINIVIVTGVKEYVEQIENIIEKIDVATRNDIEASHTKVYTLNYAKVANVKETLEKILETHTALKTHKNNFFRIVIDERTNSLIINTNILSYFQVIDEVIKKLDVPVKQVLIEAKFIEVGLDKDNSLGIDWSQFGNVNIKVDNPISYNLTNWKPTYGTLTINQFNLFLKNLDSNSNLNLLSSPRIATLDNQKAVIKISDDIITGLQTTESQSGTIYRNQIRSEVGIELEVLPRINSDSYITLEIAPKVNEARKSVLTSDGVDIIKREAKTTIVIENGNTIAIGGLIKNNLVTSNAGVPILNKIPVLNLFFAHRTTTIKKTELIIFITPTIITKSNIISDKEKDYLNRATEQTELMHIDTLEY